MPTMAALLQVLLLDADSQPLRDPAVLFESAQYKENGNLFWPDFWGPGTSEVTSLLPNLRACPSARHAVGPH